jgi:hypothetical protein
MGGRGSEDTKLIQLAQRRYGSCLLNSHKTVDHKNVNTFFTAWLISNRSKRFPRIGLASMLPAVNRIVSVNKYNTG